MKNSGGLLDGCWSLGRIAGLIGFAWPAGVNRNECESIGMCNNILKMYQGWCLCWHSDVDMCLVQGHTFDAKIPWKKKTLIQ